MTGVRVRAAGRLIPLSQGRSLSFGRDRTCDVCLDPADRGISRMAGIVEYKAGTWWVVNCSTKRTLHVVDDSRLAAPLPVNAAGWPLSRYAIGSLRTTVLVAGDLWTHELIVEADGFPCTDSSSKTPSDPRSTISQAPTLTENRRAALAALASGYLRPYPDYDPRPLSYEEAAALLGIGRCQLRKRIEQIRTQLTDAGVVGLDPVDARRSLCEWSLAMRLISVSDLALLPAVSRPSAFP